MFLKIFYYFTLVFMVFSSVPAFSASRCEGGFIDPRRSLSSPRVSSSPQMLSSSQSTSSPLRRGSTEVESYRQLLVRLTQSSLGLTSLTSQQVKALEAYHDVVRGEEGTDGTFARVGNYTFSQRRRIVKHLRQVFTPEQVSTLIETGVVEVNRSWDVKITKRVLKHFREGSKVFIQVHGYAFRISKILEETKSGFLVEAEKLSGDQGHIVKEKLFLITESNIEVPLRVVDPSDMIGISEKTDSGFVIDVLMKSFSDFEASGRETIEGNKVFLSFDKAIENGLLPKHPMAEDYSRLEETVNYYISGRFNQISVFKNGETSHKSDLKEIYDNYTTALKNSLIVGESLFKLANPELESVFLAAQSTRKKVDSKDLNFPFSREGKDYVNEWTIVKRRLQELGANPRTTHIEYFADQVPLHMAHIRRGLEEHYSPKEKSHGSKSEQLQRLDSLEEEAKKAISEERITYRWWLEFNFQLARLISGLDAHLKQEAEEGTVMVHLPVFPLMVIMPAIQTTDGLGIVTFNRVGLEGVYPAGLMNRPNTIEEVHGNILPAPEFFAHDMVHSRFEGNRIYLEYSFGHRLFHKRLLTNIENLPPEKRKKAEKVYFLMTHEHPEDNISYSRALQYVREDIIGIVYYHDDAGYFKFSDNPVQKEQEVRAIVDIFMEVYTQALQHQ